MADVEVEENKGMGGRCMGSLYNNVRLNAKHFVYGHGIADNKVYIEVVWFCVQSIC